MLYIYIIYLVYLFIFLCMVSICIPIFIFSICIEIAFKISLRFVRIMSAISESFCNRYNHSNNETLGKIRL